MTPKEKAVQLIEIYVPVIRMKMGQEDVMQRAKQCALIAVEEVLTYSKAHGFIGLTEFYEEVKQEIHLL